MGPLAASLRPWWAGSAPACPPHTKHILGAPPIEAWLVELGAWLGRAGRWDGPGRSDLRPRYATQRPKEPLAGWPFWLKFGFGVPIYGGEEDFPPPSASLVRCTRENQYNVCH